MNPDELHQQRITTRVFILCFALSLSILSFYTLLSIQTETIIKNNPNRTDYEYLQDLYPVTLKCTCSLVAVPHSNFISISPRFHQLCSSRIISRDWYTLLHPINDTLLYNTNDFQASLGHLYFQILAAFCSLAEDTFSDAYQLFSTQKFINVHAMPESIFSKQADALVDLFIMTVHSEFIRLFSFIRQIIQVDQLASETNSNYVISIDSNGEISMSSRYLSFLNPSSPFVFFCSCQNLGFTCGSYAYIHNVFNGSGEILLKNIIIKCLPIESALSSTLECWFDEQCFAAVRAVYATQENSSINDILPLNINEPSRFPINTSVEQILSEFFIETWVINISYDQYYRSCLPTSCIYTIERRFNFFVVLVTLLTVSAGLNRALRLILPFITFVFMMIVKSIRTKLHTRNQVITSNIQNSLRSKISILHKGIELHFILFEF